MNSELLVSRGLTHIQQNLKLFDNQFLQFWVQLFIKGYNFVNINNIGFGKHFALACFNPIFIGSEGVGNQFY